MEGLGVALTALLCLAVAAAIGAAFCHYVRSESEEIKDLKAEPSALETQLSSQSKNQVEILFDGHAEAGVSIRPGANKKFLRSQLPLIVRTSVTSSEDESSEEEEEEEMGRDKKGDHAHHGDFTDSSFDASFSQIEREGGVRSASFSRLPVALHRYLPFYNHFAAARARRSKSTGHLGDPNAVVVNDPLFGPISIIGRQLSPREADGSPHMLTFDADDEDFIDGKNHISDSSNGNSPITMKVSRKLERQDRIAKSFSEEPENDDVGVVRDVIMTDDENDGASHRIRMIRLSEDFGKGTAPLTNGQTQIPITVNEEKKRSLKQCDQCEYFTTSKRKLTRHKLKAHTETPISKTIEVTISPNKESNSKSKDIELTKVVEVPKLEFECSHCEFVTSKERRLMRHVKKEHPIDNQRSQGQIFNGLGET